MSQGQERDICRITYDAPHKGVPPGPPKRWLEEVRKCCLTLAAPLDDRAHNFVSPGLQVLGAFFAARPNCVPLGPPKCRVYQCKKTGPSTPDLDPVAVAKKKVMRLTYVRTQVQRTLEDQRVRRRSVVSTTPPPPQTMTTLEDQRVRRRSVLRTKGY